jgi:hypothetical protein
LKNIKINSKIKKYIYLKSCQMVDLELYISGFLKLFLKLFDISDFASAVF